ncbi:MAG: transporter, partial [Bacteroidota bacterium]
MQHYIKLIIFLFFFQFSFGQYTKVINSKRPGFSDSPYSIGTKVYQVEGGIFYKKIGNYLYWDQIAGEAVSYTSKSFGSDITLRTGLFFERLEFDLDMAVQSENRDFTRPVVYSESAFGLSKLTFGAKYLVYTPKYKDQSKEIRSWKARHAFDLKRLIPAVGVYAGVNTNFLHDLYKNPEGISPRFAIFTQNDISNRWIVLTNFIMDKAFTDESENSFILTTTYALNKKWSIFGEGQAFYRKNVPNDYQFGAGGAYLLNKDMQVDLSARMIYDERGDNTLLFGGGMSWRLDKHQDKIIQKKNELNPVEKTLSDYDSKKGFWAGVTGIFTFEWLKSNKKSSKTNRRKVKTSKVKKRDLEAPVNKKAQKAKKKRNKHLIKQQKQKEKA